MEGREAEKGGPQAGRGAGFAGSPEALAAVLAGQRLGLLLADVAVLVGRGGRTGALYGLDGHHRGEGRPAADGGGRWQVGVVGRKANEKGEARRGKPESRSTRSGGWGKGEDDDLALRAGGVGYFVG